MKKMLTIVLAICMMLSLVACGKEENTSGSVNNSQTELTNDETKTDLNGSNLADSSNMNETIGEKSPETNEDFLQKWERPNDDTYFKPASDDYVIKIIYQTETDQEAELVSFDNSGNIIQMVKRNISSSYSVDNYPKARDRYSEDNVKSEYYDNNETLYVDMIIIQKTTDYYGDWTEKYNYFKNLERYKDDYVECYYSKYISMEDTEIENHWSLGDFSGLSMFSHATEDYYILMDNESTTYEGYNYMHFEGYDADKNAIEKEVVSYDAFSFKNAIVISFDESGHVEEFLSIVVMDSADMTEDYLKYGGARKLDESKLDDDYVEEDVDWEIVNEIGYSVEGKYIWSIQEFDATKWDYGANYNSEEAGEYMSKWFLSKPYLTEKQIENSFAN